MSIEDHLTGRSQHTRELFFHFVKEFQSIGAVTVHPAKTMIGIATPRRRIAYVTHFGKDFIHVVFPFENAHSDNLCFVKIARVPGKTNQFNHHFRMSLKNDLNAEVRKFMALAFQEGS